MKRILLPLLLLASLSIAHSQIKLQNLEPSVGYTQTCGENMLTLNGNGISSVPMTTFSFDALFGKDKLYTYGIALHMGTGRYTQNTYIENLAIVAAGIKTKKGVELLNNLLAYFAIEADALFSSNMAKDEPLQTDVSLDRFGLGVQLGIDTEINLTEKIHAGFEYGFMLGGFLKDYDLEQMAVYKSEKMSSGIFTRSATINVGINF